LANTSLLFLTDQFGAKIRHVHLRAQVRRIWTPTPLTRLTRTSFRWASAEVTASAVDLTQIFGQQGVVVVGGDFLDHFLHGVANALVRPEGVEPCGPQTGARPAAPKIG
jgi:hypothetical protein